MLKQRILTALILIPVFILFLIYATPIWFCAITALLVLAASWEWSNLMNVKRLFARLLYVLFIFLVLVWALFIPMTVVFTAASVWWLIATALVLCYPRASKWWGNSFFIRGLMGAFVLMPCWAAINYIRNQTDGIYALLFLCILIWGADSAAYFVGKKWGKDKLIPLVSPGKSKQGFWAAIVSSMVIALIAAWASHTPYAIWPWSIGLSIITVIFSIVGDLFESMMKRQVGIKDSGKLLPGHGGLLDRIDSLTAAAPIFALGGILLGTFLPY